MSSCINDNNGAPIPSMVSIDPNEDNKKFNSGGGCIPGMMAPQFGGPLGLFTSKSDVLTVNPRSPEGGQPRHHHSVLKPSRHGKTIVDHHEDPLTPLSKASPTPCLVEENDSESDGDLWQRRNIQTLPPSLMLSSPDAVTQKSGLEQDDQRLVHKQTADGHYLMSSQALGSPMDGIKYSLDKGRKSMTQEMRQASDVNALIQKTRPNVMNVAASSSPSNARHLLNRMDGTAFKIFLLLIQPKSKIFEIIQVFYSSSASTVDDVLNLIPTNATEPALGSQEYAGLCRPHDGAVLDLDAAKISRGEILVAIPTGYSGPFCAKISKPILSNPKVTRLLNKSDPLAPKRNSKKKKRRETSSRRLKTIAIETVKEETESVVTKSTVVNEQELLRLAMQHAAQEAATANAEVKSSSSTTANSSKPPLATKPLRSISPAIREDDDAEIPVELWKTTMSLRTRSTRSTYSRSDSIGEGSTIASEGDPDFFSSFASLDDSSFSSSTLKRIPRRSNKKTTRKGTKTRRKQLVSKMLALVVGLMILRYYMVGRMETPPEPEQSAKSMLGVAGTMVQVILAFVSLYKLQLYVQGKGHPNNCPFVKVVQRTCKPKRA